jgi:hypothetical protein
MIIKIKEFLDYLNEKELKDVDLYTQYAEMKNAHRVLGERMEEINSIILEEMLARSENQKKFDFGNFTVVKKPVWKYSDVVKGIETTLKEIKAKEQKEGVAVKEESNYLLFK